MSTGKDKHIFYMWANTIFAGIFFIAGAFLSFNGIASILCGAMFVLHIYRALHHSNKVEINV